MKQVELDTADTLEVIVEHVLPKAGFDLSRPITLVPPANQSLVISPMVWMAEQEEPPAAR